MQGNCTICFGLLKRNEKIDCHGCDSEVCNKCVSIYIKNSKTIPICPNLNCNYILDFNNVKASVEPEILDIYCNLCYNFVIEKSESENVSSSIISKIRDERLEFIKKNFPVSINSVISICYKSKLDKISKDNKNHVKKMLKKVGRNCVNGKCKGNLLETKDSLICNKCNLIFCIKCEELQDTDHSCLQETIDSVNMKNKLERCPVCVIPYIEKCGICESIVNLKFEGKLSSYLEKEEISPEILESVEAIERKEKVNTLKSILKYIKKNDESDSLASDVSKKYSSYFVCKMFNMKLNKIYSQIYNLHLTSDLNLKIVNELGEIEI